MEKALIFVLVIIAVFLVDLLLALIIGKMIGMTKDDEQKWKEGLK